MVTELNDIRLVVLDMAGTTVADGGLVERAFAAAAAELGVEPGSADHAAKLDHVRATMGESKISVFRHLFGEEALARRANAAFEKAYGELVDDGHIAPVAGAREAIEELQGGGRTVALTTGFARVTQDAILDALGWGGLVPLTLCPADAGGRGRPYPDMVLEAFLRTGAAEGSTRSPSSATPRTTCSAVYAPGRVSSSGCSPGRTDTRRCAPQGPGTYSARWPNCPR